MGQYYDTGDGRNEPLILHWDGSSWSQVSSSLSNEGYLYGVTTVSSSEAYAVGKYVSSGNTYPLVLVWGSGAWTQPVSFNTNSNAVFHAASVGSGGGTTKITAVGQVTAGSTFVRESTDGGANWSNPGSGSGIFSQMRGVARVTDQKGLAVGYTGVDFWQWRQDTGSTNWFNTTYAVSDDRYLQGVALRSYNSGTNATDFWAVGFSYNPAGPPGTDLEALVLRRDGNFASASWADDSPANVGSYDNYLYGVSTTSSSDVFVVGHYYDGTNYQTLIHSCAP